MWLPVAINASPLKLKTRKALLLVLKRLEALRKPSLDRSSRNWRSGLRGYPAADSTASEVKHFSEKKKLILPKKQTLSLSLVVLLNYCQLTYDECSGVPRSNPSARIVTHFPQNIKEQNWHYSHMLSQMSELFHREIKEEKKKWSLQLVSISLVRMPLVCIIFQLLAFVRFIFCNSK